MAVSFSKDIKPLFRPMDVEHMHVYGVPLDDYAYMSDAANDHQNAQAVLRTLIEKTMPPGGPFWSQEQLDLFQQWMADGYQP